MHQTLLDLSARRWLAGIALLAGLAALVVSFAPTSVAQDAQDTPPPPHWFWGNDADAYAGETVQAVDQDGVVLAVAEGSDNAVNSVVSGAGEWSYQIKTDEATLVRFRITTSRGTLETSSFPVSSVGLTQVPIADFRSVAAPSETKEINVIARLHPTRESRTLEFNIRVGGVDVDPPPSRRYLGPSLAYNRWLQSSPIDAGDGYTVRVIACKQNDDDVIFGVRVEGHDDIIPRQRRLATSITHNRWLRSSLIEIPMPGDSEDVVRLREDEGCTGGGLG